jgi:hypothetical protein
MTTSRNRTSKPRCARLANLRRLAAELQLRAMRITDVCALLTVKESAARGYVNTLGAVIDVTHGARFEDGYIYRLIDDADVDACLANLGKAPRKPVESKSQVSRAARGGRGIHVMQDDEPHNVKVASMRIPQHDPLLAAFFGLAQEQQP